MTYLHRKLKKSCKLQDRQSLLSSSIDLMSDTYFQSSFMNLFLNLYITEYRRMQMVFKNTLTFYLNLRYPCLGFSANICGLHLHLLNGKQVSLIHCNIYGKYHEKISRKMHLNLSFSFPSFSPIQYRFCTKNA